MAVERPLIVNRSDQWRNGLIARTGRQKFEDFSIRVDAAVELTDQFENGPLIEHDGGIALLTGQSLRVPQRNGQCGIGRACRSAPK